MRHRFLWRALRTDTAQTAVGADQQGSNQQNDRRDLHGESKSSPRPSLGQGESPLVTIASLHLIKLGEPMVYRQSNSAFQSVCNCLELLQNGLQIVGNFLGDDLRLRQIIRVFEGRVLQPEQVEVDLVSFDQVGVVE